MLVRVFTDLAVVDDPVPRVALELHHDARVAAEQLVDVLLHPLDLRLHVHRRQHHGRRRDVDLVLPRELLEDDVEVRRRLQLGLVA